MFPDGAWTAAAKGAFRAGIPPPYRKRRGAGGRGAAGSMKRIQIRNPPHGDGAKAHIFRARIDIPCARC